MSDLIQLRVRAMAHGGDAVAHPEDPDKKETWFVRGGLPGEIVRVRPSPPKGRHLRGEVAEVVEASESRTEPPCAHAGTCGGCQWQHVGLDAQLALKEEIVRGALRRLPLELRRAVPSPEGLGYRRRARMHYRNEDGEFSLGFFGAGSRDVVDIPRCIVLHPVLDQALQRLRALAPQLPERGEVHAITDGERVVIGLGGVSPSRARLDAASALLDDVVVGITLRGGRKRETVGVSALAIDGDHGRLPIVTTPFVFAQAQAEQNEALVKHVAKATSSEGHKVLELFCGGGNLTRAVAEGAAGVWAVDDDREAIARLRDMVKAVGLPVRARRGSSKTELERYVRQQRSFDVVVVDPPRTGLGGEVANLISKVTDTRIVYVSCDPATLARDLEVLLAAGFRGVDLRIFDMMPMTAEVEVVAILDRARPRETPRDD